MIYDLQKASMWKRISAFLFDAILLGIVAVLFGWLLSNILGYDRYNATLNASYDKYAEEFNVNFHMSLSEYEQMTAEQSSRLDEAYAALSADSAAVHAYNMVKINAVTLFIRTVLGKYTLETMIPVLILIMIYWGTIGVVGPIVLLLILIVEAATLIASHTNALIHDLLAGTVAVDIASQMIFDTTDDMIAYKQKVHAEAAARQDY